MPKTLECYDCHEQVANLAQHRSLCAKPKRPAPMKSATQCHDSHQEVTDLKVQCVLQTNSTARPTQLVAEQKDFFFLLDVSGSMVGRRIADAKAALCALFEALNATDRFALVTFDTSAHFKCKPRPVGQLKRQNEIPSLLERIFTGGRTALYDAIALSVEQVWSATIPTTILVLTDGEDNSSTHTLAQIEALLVIRPNIRLSIVHISDGGSALEPYTLLCQKRGLYVVISETVIVLETLRICNIMQSGLF